jgi:hypothetical protein
MTKQEIENLVKELRLFYVESWLPEDKPEELVAIYKMYVYNPNSYVAVTENRKIYSSFYCGYATVADETAEESLLDSALTYAYNFTEDSEQVMYFSNIEKSVILPEDFMLPDEGFDVSFSNYDAMRFVAETLKDMEYAGDSFSLESWYTVHSQ